MSIVDVETGEVLEVLGDEYLEDLAAIVRAQVRRSRESVAELAEAYFAIGHALEAAQRALSSKQAFGAWFAAQNFGFTTQWGLVLRSAAELESYVRPAFESQLSNGRTPNFDKIVKQARAAYGGTRYERPDLRAITGPAPAEPEVIPDVFSAIVIDPPWRYDNVATRGAAEDHYRTMSMEQLRELVLPAADDSHLYLCVTNGFMREGFELMEVWGFTYKTVLTWCKPQIGMGNYFRNSTEHVLFGVRGSLATLRNDCPTWFVADRTKHSAKPLAFFDLVTTCSPGPYLEMFARERRLGWHVWGNEA